MNLGTFARASTAKTSATQDRLHYYHCDHLGTPLELLDDAGKPVWAARYRAWGQVLSYDVREVEQPLRFQGQYLDEETGLHYNRHRYYDPEAGRFVSQDPIGLDGSENLYQYAPNPTAWIDPLGLARGTNGNSKCSTKAQHGYEIIDTKNGNAVVKTGVSGGRIRIDGKSSRAEKQVRAWNSEPGNTGRYESRIVRREPAGPCARENILNWETQNANANRATLDPARHSRP